MKLNENRSALRIKENASVHWHIREKQLTGEARIHNISSTGMMIETMGSATRGKLKL